VRYESGAFLRNHVPALWTSEGRKDADGRLPVLLRMRRLQHYASPKGRRLLRLLFLRHCPLSSNAMPAVLRQRTDAITDDLALLKISQDDEIAGGLLSIRCGVPVECIPGSDCWCECAPREPPFTGVYRIPGCRPKSIYRNQCHPDRSSSIRSAAEAGELFLSVAAARSNDACGRSEIGSQCSRPIISPRLVCADATSESGTSETRRPFCDASAIRRPTDLRPVPLCLVGA
jgi:hypothetical protein